jgi:hypothetical protein
MKFNSISLIICVLLLFLGVLKLFAGGALLADFSTPENTIKTYYSYYNNRDVLSECFYPTGFNGSLDKFWSTHQIIEKKVTSKYGESTHTGVIISKDAMEFIVEVEIKNSKNKSQKTKFWYLLQKINGKWKIIDHSHISDEAYPPYESAEGGHKEQ